MTALSVLARWDPARLRGRGRAHVAEAAGPARHLSGGSLVGEGLNKVGGAGHPRGSPFESVPTPRFPFQLGQPRALARAPGRPRPPGGGRAPPLSLSLRVRSCSVYYVGPRHPLQASKWTLGLRGRRHVPAPNLPAAGGAQVGRELGVRGARSAWIPGGTARGGGGDTGSAPLRFFFCLFVCFLPLRFHTRPPTEAPRGGHGPGAAGAAAPERTGKGALSAPGTVARSKFIAVGVFAGF